MSAAPAPPPRPGTRLRRVAAVVLGCLAVLVVLPPGSAAQVDTGDDDDSSGGRSEPLTQPTGQVAYATPDGQVWLGDGDLPPVLIGEGAAIGWADQAAVAVSPTADAVAWVRADGSLVSVPIGGGAPTVLATDVALDWLGREPILSWDGTGENLAYIAKGTSEYVKPRDGQPRIPKDPDSFPVALPSGILGNMVRTVNRTGAATGQIGDPSERSFIGLNWSLIDGLMVLDSVIPGTEDRYTLSIGAMGGPGEGPTPVSADDPDFAPDGSYVVAVGPAKGHQELIRVALDDLSQKVLAQDERICNPLVSPDATRIVYGAGANCERVMLISSKGGQAFDVTPVDAPDNVTYGAGEMGWTTDGKFLTLPDCRISGGEPTCAGEVTFLEPDSGRVLPGPLATTVAPIRRPLVQDVWIDIELRGPFEFRGSFPVNQEVEGRLVETDNGLGNLEGEVSNGTASMAVKLTAGPGYFVTGTLTAVDPEAGIDRQFLVLGRAQVLGARIFSIAGAWWATDDLPFATGEFNVAVRRR